MESILLAVAISVTKFCQKMPYRGYYAGSLLAFIRRNLMTYAERKNSAVTAKSSLLLHI